MLTLTLEATDEYPAAEVNLEHSLVSMSKWESKYEKAFYGKEEKTSDQTLDYIEFMVLNPALPPDFRNRLENPKIVEAINKYINSKQTATWFSEQQQQGRPSTESITNELIYYWMIQFQIPSDYQYWHINRLMTLIKICGIKQTPPKKMSKAAQAEEMRRLNKQRLEALKTTG